MRRHETTGRGRRRPAVGPGVRVAACVLLLLLGICRRVHAQAGYEDDRVMLQGFYWESARHGHPQSFPTYGSRQWYDIVAQQADEIRHARFDLIWLPPPSDAGPFDEGYGPRELYKLDNSYGSFQRQRAMLVALLHDGVEPIADVVVNHRNGTTGWAQFTNPAWGTSAICKSDEAFSDPRSEVVGTPESARGADEESTAEYAPGRGHTYAYPIYRDLDHTNPQVHHDVVRYLLALESMGYRGWRYDMVHGYHARWIAYYNRLTHPTFSVGEYDWDKHAEQRGWMWYSATASADVTGDARLATASSVFDFTTFTTLKDHKGDYAVWYGLGHGIGMVGDTTDGLAWKNRAVTFVENHDTGHRTLRDGTPDPDHLFDSFSNSSQVEQAYAQILTHPGVPCVFWKHYFDWGDDLRNKLRALINARKVAGVHAGSRVDLQDVARTRGVYAARVEGRHGALYVRIGGSDADWQPGVSGYQDYREYARGAGWTVWVGLPGNPAAQQAPLHPALPVPAYRRAQDFVLPPDPP